MTEDQTLELTPGKPYFVLVYADSRLTIPIIQTLVYERHDEGLDGRVKSVFREYTARGQEDAIVIDFEHVADLLLNEEQLAEKLIRS